MRLPRFPAPQATSNSAPCLRASNRLVCTLCAPGSRAASCQRTSGPRGQTAHDSVPCSWLVLAPRRPIRTGAALGVLVRRCVLVGAGLRGRSRGATCGSCGQRPSVGINLVSQRIDGAAAVFDQLVRLLSFHNLLRGCGIHPVLISLRAHSATASARSIGRNSSRFKSSTGIGLSAPRM